MSVRPPCEDPPQAKSLRRSTCGPGATELVWIRFSDENLKFLSERCVRWRDQRGITMEDAAIRAGCSPYAWNAIELGLPTAKMLAWTDVANVIKLILRVSPRCQKVYHGEEKAGP